MTIEKPDTTPLPNGDASSPEVAAPETAPAEGEVSPEARLAAVEAQREDLRDKLLRLLADMENLRRRTERDVADARAYGITRFAQDMLNVGDNLRRALESVPAEAASAAEGAFRGLIDGVELTERDFLKSLERHGVRRLDPQGQRFDPNLHQAMFEVPDPGVPSGTVVQVMQAGYQIGERVLRPALVGVAKGGPKPAAEPKPEAETAGEPGSA